MIVKVKWPEDLFRLALPAKPLGPLKLILSWALVPHNIIYCSISLMGNMLQYDMTEHSEHDRANY